MVPGFDAGRSCSNNLRRAQEVWDMARRTPTVENFGELAGKYSIERSSRALLGEVPPIRKIRRPTGLGR